MRIAIAVLVVCLVAVPVLAADAPAKKTRPIGSWSKKVEARTITFAFKADDTLTVTLAEGDATVEVAAEYGVTKDGTLFGVITGVKKTGTETGPSEGELFSFRFKAEKETLNLSDLVGTNTNAAAKALVEGEYKSTK